MQTTHTQPMSINQAAPVQGWADLDAANKADGHYLRGNRPEYLVAAQRKADAAQEALRAAIVRYFDDCIETPDYQALQGLRDAVEAAENAFADAYLFWQKSLAQAVASSCKQNSMDIRSCQNVA